MRVGELIETLKKHPENMRILVHGYEGGYWDAEVSEELTIHLHTNKDDLDLFGLHDDAVIQDDRDVEAILIQGRKEP